MKLFYFLLMLIPSVSFSQVTFWTESFQNLCNGNCEADSYVGPNGAWLVNQTGINEDDACVWYVSGAECGMDAGECGEDCGTTDASLHIGISSTIFGIGDIGASFLNEGGGVFSIVTDIRAESPTINCSAYTDIEISFNYIEGGNLALDDATLWYYDGNVWSQINALAKTAITGCAPQGTWTAFNMTLPVSASNNPNVKIGFRWVNNDDAVGLDPTIAVDDITLVGMAGGGDIEPPEILCGGDLAEEMFVANNCVVVIPNFTQEFLVTDNVDPFPLVTQIPIAGTMIFEPTEITLTAMDFSGNSASCSFTIFPFDSESPEITCQNDITVTALEGEVDAFVTVPDAVAEDCGAIDGFQNDYNNTGFASDTYPIGSTIVTITAFDEFENFSSCTTTITVLEVVNDCCLGDFNCDGVVSVLDLIILIGQYGCTVGCTADLDDDNIVGTMDMNIFISLYSDICP